jgi:amino-acid N-acetyltransferase
LRLKGQEPRYYNGMRVTDSIALDCAQEAAGQLRYEIEAAFSQGLPNTPMAGARVRVISGNFLTARPVGIVDGVDFMHSGLVRKVDVEGIRSALDSEAMVLVSPFGFSPTGEAFNLSMEEVATRVAIELKADKLLFLTEVPGVRMDPSGPADENNPIDTELPLDAARRLLAQLPPAQQPTDVGFYLQHCVRACEHGVERSHILPFSTDGALLLEIYVHDGIGTMVIDEKLEELREATIDDVGGIIQLIEPFERDGTLVKRDRTEIERDIASYTVIEHDGVIFGCAALHPTSRPRPPKWPPSPSRPRARARAMAKSCSSASSSAPAPGLRNHVCADHAHHALVHQARLSARGARMAAGGPQGQVQLGPQEPGAGEEALIRLHYQK